MPLRMLTCTPVPELGYDHVCKGVYKCKKWLSGPLDLELEVIVRWPALVQGLWSYVKVVRALKH